MRLRLKFGGGNRSCQRLNLTTFLAITVQIMFEVAGQVGRPTVTGQFRNSIRGICGHSVRRIVRYDDGNTRVLRQMNISRKFNAPVPIDGFNRLAHRVHSIRQTARSQEGDDAEAGRRKGQSIDSVVNAVRQHRGENLQIEYSRAFESMPSQQVNPPSLWRGPPPLRSASFLAMMLQTVVV